MNQLIDLSIDHQLRNARKFINSVYWAKKCFDVIYFEVVISEFVCGE